MRITTQALGPLPNAPAAARPSTSNVPEYKQFTDFIHYFRKLQLKDIVDVSVEENDKQINLKMIFKESAKHRAELDKLYRLLGFKPEGNMITISQGPKGQNDGSHMTIITRSALGMMYYLSKSVEVTHDELESGVVEFPQYKNGKYFDWQQVTRGMMRIRASFKKPCCAAVSVYYRGKWYYIADNDMNSKETLSLMALIFALQAGDIKSQSAPLLTLAV